jgi:large repetitive protein
MEVLEQRQLMAADILAFHNDLVAKDVNGDFQISPLDALVVINRLNTQGGGSLIGKAPTDGSSYVDVDGDNILSPLDVLSVINSINRGEGVGGELAEVKYQFFTVNADGTAGTQLPDPTPDNGQPDAVISPGQKVIVRTTIADLRRPANGQTPRGVFSAYHDLNFANADPADATDRLQYQWGEFDLIKIQDNVISGSFQVQYGSDTSAAISLVFVNGVQDSTGTAAAIQSELEKLPSIGAGNVKVLLLQDERVPDPGNPGNFINFYRFGASFINQRARTDVANPTVVANNLASFNTTPVILTVAGQTNPDPSTQSVAQAGRKHDIKTTTPAVPDNTQFTNGPDGILKSVNASTKQLALLGGFTGASTFLQGIVATATFNVVDTLFVGASTGTVNLTGTISPLPISGSTDGDNLGIALFGQDNGRASYLTAEMVILPRGSISIVDRLTAIGDVISATEDDPLTTINVVQNDIDVTTPVTPRNVTAVTQPTNGAGTVSFSGPNVSYTPAKDFNGSSTFTYTVANGNGNTAIGTVQITVSAVNDPPVLIRTTPFSVVEDATAPLVIAPTDVFAPGPANESTQTTSLSVLSILSPQNAGTATLVGGSINFLPAPNFFGPVVLQVTGSDGSLSTVGTVTVNVTPVNDAPIPFNGTLIVNEDTNLILIGTGAANDLLTKSSPGPGETGTVSLVSVQSLTAQGGTITTVAGVTTYRGASNFFGTDTFTYTITDGELQAVGTVTVTVNSVNDPAIAVDDTGADRFAVPGIAAANPLNVLRNDNPGAANETPDYSVISVTAASIGTVAVAPNGAGVIFTPPTGQFNVTSTFRYTIRDAAGNESSANVEVLIIPPILPFALFDSKSVAEGASATPIDVLSNDFANAGSTKRLLSFTQPSVGVVTLNNNGTPSDLTDDTVSFVAPTDFFGSTSFTYTMIDSAVDTNPAIVASTGTVTVTVTPVNDPPVAADRTVAGTEDTVLDIPSATITDGLSKGPGEDAQVLTITAVENQTANSGTVSIVNGNVRFAPAADYFGQVLIRYTVTDDGITGTAPAPLSSSAILTINIAPVNDAPIATADPIAVTSEGTALTISGSTLLLNDRPGPANEIQTVTIGALTSGTSAKGGTVTQVGTNFVYTPAATFNGQDTFTYTISDGQTANSTTTATATINVTEVNDAPTAPNQSGSVFASVPTNFDLTAALAAAQKGPANESGQTLRVTRVIPGAGTKGSVVLNANGTITYTAALGASGLDSFTFEVTDNGTTNGVADPKSAIGTFNITVSPFIPSSVKGFVYVDDNNSRSIDSVELKLGGVEVTLVTAATSTTAQKSVTKKTLADGSYSFDLLPPGAYTVSYVVPSRMDDADGPNSYTVDVVAPGDINVVRNFAVLGINADYSNQLEYMSSVYDSSNPRNRLSGIYASIGADGVSDWTIARVGFENDLYQEVVLSNDGKQAFVTSVRGPEHSIYTATLGIRQFVKMDLPDGSKIVRVMARQEDLNWQKVTSVAAPPVDIKAKSRGYFETIDDVFAEQGW